MFYTFKIKYNFNIRCIFPQASVDIYAAITGELLHETSMFYDLYHWNNVHNAMPLRSCSEMLNNLVYKYLITVNIYYD